MKLSPITMTDSEFIDYLNSSRICGQVATPRENNLAHIHGFVAGDEHLEFGVKLRRQWTFDDVFELMVRRVGIGADPDFLEGQDTISAEKCLDALYRYARLLGEAVADQASILFATGHPAGLFPIYAELASLARAAGARPLAIREGASFRDGDIRQMMDVVMWHQYGSLQHTHFPGPMELALSHLADEDITPDLVVADHGLAGYAASCGLATLGIADCNDPGLFVSAEQGDIRVAVPMDDNVPPHLYRPVIEFIAAHAGLL